MVKAVIFDMDGLMVDTEPIQSESFELVLKEHGVEPRRNKFGVVQTIGVTALDNWKILRLQYGLLNVDLDELVARKRQIYSELLAGRIAPMPGLLDLIATLDQQRVKKAVASSSSLHHIGMVVESLGIESFDVLASGEHVERGKPHPDIFLRAAELLDVQPQECVVLEDAESGVNGGKAAGMKVIAVPNRFTLEHDFANAHAVVASLETITWPPLSEL
jgi:HAD superfamily hydrolase (TIGR01509 family)